MIHKNRLRNEDIEKKLSDITDAVEIIEDNLPKDYKSFTRLGLIKEGIYKKTEYALESIIDICNIINSDLRLGVPNNEDNLLDNLEKNKIFDKKIINLIREMKRFRNVLVHKYGDIEDKQAYKDIKEGLSDFETVIKEIDKFLKRFK